MAEDYAGEHNLTNTDIVSEKGVYFAEFTNGDETFYYRLDDDYYVDDEYKFVEIGSRQSYTTAQVEGEEFHRMVDDDGVHDRISEYIN